VSLRLSRGVKEMVSIEGNKWRGERNQRGASASLILLVSPDFWWRELLDFHWVVGFELG
jgi:hypothetical protein